MKQIETRHHEIGTTLFYIDDHTVMIDTFYNIRKSKLKIVEVNKEVVYYHFENGCEVSKSKVIDTIEQALSVLNNKITSSL